MDSHRVQQRNREKHKWEQTFGPRKQDRVERVVQRQLEQYNLKGIYAQGLYEEKEDNSEQQEVLALGVWPWDYPKYGISKIALRKWEGARKFHDLMWDMQKLYEDKVWQLYREKEIGFTYRSEFERKIDELLEALQALIFSKLWNDGKDGTTAHVLGATQHRGYHYKHEGFLYNLYVKRIFLPLYGGLHGSVGNGYLEQEQE